MRDTTTVARAVLALDAAGCAAAATALAVLPRRSKRVEVTGPARTTLVVALGATSALLASGAVPQAPTRRALARAAGVNTVWVLACLASLCSRPSRRWSLLIATTAVLDAAAAVAQLALARRVAGAGDRAPLRPRSPGRPA